MARAAKEKTADIERFFFSLSPRLIVVVFVLQRLTNLPSLNTLPLLLSFFFFLVCRCRLLAIHKHQWKKPVCAVGETKIKREEGEKKGR